MAGEADAADPTELAGVAEMSTEFVQAWSLDEADEDYPLTGSWEDPERCLTPPSTPPILAAKPKSSSRARNIILIAGGVVIAGSFITYLVSDHSRLTMDRDNSYYQVDSSNAGTYLTVGPREGEECSWGRLSKPRQTADSILEVGIGEPGRNTTVTLHPGEYFVSSGCRPWRKQ